MTSESNQIFLEWLEHWVEAVPVQPISSLFADPLRSAILSVDVINGFCSEGALASPRVARIIDPITHLMASAWAVGVRNILLLQDTHEPDAVEFSQWPPHCVKGTTESDAVPQIKAMPFYNSLTTINKNSIHSGMNNRLDAWIDAHPTVSNFIVVGDCTDLCTYQLAMHLRLQANEKQLSRRVILPMECVDTYHLGVEDAKKLGILPHPGDLIHSIFLYHMALNGIEIIRAE